MKSLSLYFINVVWGDEYTNLLLQVSLPSQLSPDNLGSFCKESGDRYKIYTTKKDAVKIENSQAFSRLNKFIQTDIHYIDEFIEGLDYNKRYEAFTSIQDTAMRETVQNNAIFVNLNPHTIYSDGAFRRVKEIAFSGKRIIATTSMRVNKEDMLPELMKDWYSESDCSIGIPPRELTKLSLKYLNNGTKNLFWKESEYFPNYWPTLLYWKVKDKGVLQRGLHLWPLMMNPVNREEPVISPVPRHGLITIDVNDYICRAVPDFNDVYVVTDSDEMCFFTLDSKDKVLPPPPAVPQRASILQVAYFIYGYYRDLTHYINFLKPKIRFHAEDISPEWEDVEKESDKIIDSILACIDFYDRVPDATMDFVRQRISIQNLYSSINSLLLDSAMLRNSLGEELYRAGRVEDAERVFLEALNIVPDNAVIHANLGSLYRRLGRYDKAVWHLEQVVNSNNGSDGIRSCHELGLCYMGLERYQDAKSSFEKTIKLIEGLTMDGKKDLNLSALTDCYIDASVKLIKCLVAMRNFNYAKDMAEKFLNNKYIEINTNIRTDISSLMKRLDRFIV